jgi:hypothetical protein
VFFSFWVSFFRIFCCCCLWYPDFFWDVHLCFDLYLACSGFDEL